MIKRHLAFLAALMLASATAAQAQDGVTVKTAEDFGTFTAGPNNSKSGYYTLESKTYTLSNDIATSGYLLIPEGVSATIDLKGHTIDRGLTTKINGGMVIKIAENASLTIKDGGTGGTVKGGMSYNYYTSCVELYTNATFSLEGGTLVGNGEGDGVVYVEDGGTLNMSGGKITGGSYGVDLYGNATISGGDISGNGYGVDCYSVNLQLSGNPVIYGNTTADVHLYNDYTISISGNLTDGAKIGISKENVLPLNESAAISSQSTQYITDATLCYFVCEIGYSLSCQDGTLILRNDCSGPLFDEQTHVLTLRGRVRSYDDVASFSNATSVTCEPATVLPQNCSGLFHYFYKAATIDLSNADLSNVKNCTAMFLSCNNLTTIYVNDTWNMPETAKSSNMFLDCSNKLCGGNGTKFISSKTDGTYANIDGKDGQKGYLSTKALTIINDNGILNAVLDGDYTADATLYIGSDIEVSRATFNRTFTPGVYSTIILPFVYTPDNSVGEFFEFNGVKHEGGEWIAEVTPVSKKVKANTPYLFKPKTDKVSLTNNGATLKPYTSASTNPSEIDKWSFVGMYTNKKWTSDDQNDYGFAGEEDGDIQVGEFVKVAEGATISPFRCYLTYKGEGGLTKSATDLPDRIIVRITDPDSNTSDTDPAETITPVSAPAAESDVKVWSANRAIFIESQPGTEYTIVDLSGRVLKTGTSHATREQVTLSATGIVIVKIGNRTFKIQH